MSSRTLFVGDVHGCAEELKRLLKKARADRVILLGDLFTRGPDPRGVWKLIEKWEAEAVLGNHDQAVLSTWTPGKQLPKRAFRWLARQPVPQVGADAADVVDLAGLEGRDLRVAALRTGHRSAGPHLPDLRHRDRSADHPTADHPARPGVRR